MKKIDYARSSLRKSLDLANAVDDLGGSCNSSTCAEKMGKKKGGSFSSIISSAVKYGFIIHKKENLNVTQRYKNIKHAYDDEEKNSHLKKAFLNIPLFNNIYEKYKGIKLPIEILDKILIKEFEVEEKIAKRVGGYFIYGAKMVGLLNQDNTFNQEKDHQENKKTEEIKTEKETLTLGKNYAKLFFMTRDSLNLELPLNSLEDWEDARDLIEKKMNRKFNTQGLHAPTGAPEEKEGTSLYDEADNS